jgi:hypothetical protein
MSTRVAAAVTKRPDRFLRCQWCRGEMVRRSKLPNVAACQNQNCREFDRPMLIGGKK